MPLDARLRGNLLSHPCPYCGYPFAIPPSCCNSISHYECTGGRRQDMLVICDRKVSLFSANGQPAQVRETSHWSTASRRAESTLRQL